MPKYLLSKEQSDYLVSIIEGRRVSEVTKMLNEHFGTSFTEKQIDAYKHNHKLKSGINPGRCLGSCRKYTMEQIEYLREIAPGRGTDEIARMFNERWGTNYTRQQILQACSMLVVILEASVEAIGQITGALLELRLRARMATCM